MGFSAGKTQNASQCPRDSFHFTEIVVVLLYSWEHDLKLKEQEGDQFRVGTGVSARDVVAGIVVMIMGGVECLNRGKLMRHSRDSSINLAWQ